ncbi:MAG: Ig-like domain-containing protein, partial [Solirubrobacterales bacterium]
PTPATYTWNIDTLVPAVPSITSPASGAPLADSTPTVTGTAEPSSTVTIYVDDNPVGTAPVNGSGNWTFTITPALGDGPHTIAVRATDDAGNESGDSLEVEITIDTVDPTGDVTKRPDSGTPGASPTFDISVEAGSTFTCSIDGGVFVACSSPYTPGTLPAGSHTLVVRFVDPAGNTTDRSSPFSISSIPTPTPTPAPTPAPAPAPAPDVCPVVDGEVGTPAKVTVTGVTVSRKTLLKFNVSSDQFAIVRVTVKNGSKKIGTAARAVSSGKRQVVVKIKKLPAKNARLAVRLSSVSLSGGKGVADAALIVDGAGKIGVGPLNGNAGDPIVSVVECGKESGAAPIKVKVAATGKVKIGANKLNVTASASQFAVSTFTVIQNAKILSRKVFVLIPGKTLTKPVKFLGSAKLVKGKVTIKASTFSVDGVRVTTSKNITVK